MVCWMLYDGLGYHQLIFGNIYGIRQFYVKDMGETSNYCAQFHGISQGCPLSPFLFVILMTIIMHDSTVKLHDLFGDILSAPLFVKDLLYADDTLLINHTSENIQRHMDVIISTGAEYGLEINWKKVEMMGLRCQPAVFDMSGQFIDQKTSFQYLGALISADGCIQSEVNRRIGMAVVDFKVLAVLWTHSNVSKYDKYKIYLGCIVSKLLYGLQTAWLTKAQRTKLDGFHARCIRKIVGVQHSYWSRVTNVEVLSRVNAIQLSILLREQQLVLFAKIYRRPPHDVLRQVVFQAGSDQLVLSEKRRRRGRPKLAWATELRKIAVNIGAGSLQDAMGNADKWTKMRERILPS